MSLMNNQENFKLVALKRQIERFEEELKNRCDSENLDYEPEYAVLFTGSWQSAIPNQLICDPELSPIEKITWQVWRLAITNPGKPGASPRSSDLMRHINCSKPTLSAAKSMLRATRWATLCRSVRNSYGRFIGDIYLLHDEPLSIAATLELDPGYLRFLEKLIMSEKKNKRLRAAAVYVMQSVRMEEMSPQQVNELERCINHMSLFSEKDGHLLYTGDGEQQIDQVKNFNLVKPDEKEIHKTNNSKEEELSDQVKNFNLGKQAKHEQKETQIKNFDPDGGGLKNFLTPSSSSYKNKNNIYNARARDKEIPRFEDQTMRDLISCNIPMLSDSIIDLWERVFLAREAVIPIIVAKLRPLPRVQQVNVMSQLLGRLHQAEKNQAAEVRDVVKYCHSLIQLELKNELIVDEHALRIKESVEMEMPLVI